MGSVQLNPDDKYCWHGNNFNIPGPGTPMEVSIKIKITKRTNKINNIGNFLLIAFFMSIFTPQT